MKYLYAFILIAAIALALVWFGHSRGYDSGVADTQKAAQQKVDTANGERDEAIAERDAEATTVVNVKRLLAAKKQELDLANFIADAVLKNRNQLQKQLAAANAARIEALRKAAHASPDCADLAHLPVCPAVAERLWGQAADTKADASH